MTIGKRNRIGFTLVELLVVISIIGMLMALLLPAVQSAREAGRGNTCRNSQRNLALAMMQYEQKKGYPGYVNEVTLSNTASVDPRSWTFMLMPYLEHNDIWDAYSTAGTGQPTQTLEILICPSDPPEGTGNPPTSYVLNTGMQDGPVHGSRPADHPGNGVGHNQVPKFTTGTPPVQQPITKMTAGYISSGDGLQNTLLITENVDAKSWVLNSETPSDIWEGEMGCIWGYTDVSTDTPPIVTPADFLTINNKIGEGDILSTDWPQYARPSANHPGGVNVAFCDGHVRFLSETIDYRVFCLLMTPRGKAAKSTADGTTLNSTTGSPFGLPLDESEIQ